MIVKGVATAVAASTIIQTGKGIMTTAKHPFVVFSLGIAAGYLAHKYRKESISITSKTAEQSKAFVLRQKESLKDLLAEALFGIADRPRANAGKAIERLRRLGIKPMIVTGDTEQTARYVAKPVLGAG